MRRLFDFVPLFDELRRERLSEWADDLQRRCEQATSPERHGNLEQWKETFASLPPVQGRLTDCSNGRVTIDGEITDDQRTALKQGLMSWHPWRKGPFELFGIHIDTEWRSDWKWNRISPHLDFRNLNVLDVGCGNGYYGWRMLQQGARRVIGLDPQLLYVMQHEVVRRLAGGNAPNYVLPVGDDSLTSRTEAFDLTLSMGVLYHRSSPIDHLQTLAGTLKRGGRVLLETLIVEDQDDDPQNSDDDSSSDVGPHRVLVPSDRYAMMRNVWFIPSIALLKRWLIRTGFHDIQVLDVSGTTSQEQRRTEWMTFESLADFLDPNDPGKTIEGYPGPVRAAVTAVRR